MGTENAVSGDFQFFFHEKYYAYECFESTKGQAWTLTTNMQLFIKNHDVFNEKVTISYFFTKKIRFGMTNIKVPAIIYYYEITQNTIKTKQN